MCVWNNEKALENIRLWFEVSVHGYMREDFFTCCCLHNEMLDMMESHTTRYRVLRGLANQTDGMWLSDGCDDMQLMMEFDANEPPESQRQLAMQWAARRRRLAEHLYFSRRKTLD